MHKFSELEDGRHTDVDLYHLVQNDERFRKTRENIQKTNILIIDEVSMVSSKILRQVELVCRLAKNCQTYFGSIQVILCGDFYQLPPIKDELYGDFGHYCFEVDFFNKIFPHTVTLKNVHRQAANEDHLITAVNELEKGCLLNDTKLVELFTHCHLFLRPAVELDETHLEERNVPDSACISSICDELVQKTTDLCFWFNRIVSLFVAVSVGQFRKDYLTSVRREETKALRKRVLEKSKKTQHKIYFSFICQDSSENKLASHLKLKSECLLNAKFYMNFTKKELHFLTEAYGCKVSQRKSKEEIGTVLSQKLQQSSHSQSRNSKCYSTMYYQLWT